MLIALVNEPRAYIGSERFPFYVQIKNQPSTTPGILSVIRAMNDPLRTVYVESKVYISEHYEHILQVKTPKLSTK